MLHGVALVTSDVPSKRLFVLEPEPHGVTSQKTAFFLLVTVLTNENKCMKISMEDHIYGVFATTNLCEIFNLPISYKETGIEMCKTINICVAYTGVKLCFNLKGH
jgi:hypothetical protein